MNGHMETKTGVGPDTGPDSETDMMDAGAKTYAAMTERLLAHMPRPGDYPTPVGGLVLHRRDVVNKPENCWNRPILAMTVQGAKRVVVGTEEYRYGAGNSLLAGVDLPSFSYLTDASPEKPYLVMTLELDSHLITQLVAQTAPLQSSPPSGEGQEGAPGTSHASPSGIPPRGAAVMPTDPQILEAFGRLLDLLDTPEHIPVLGSLIIHEIHALLLLGQQGPLLKALNTQGTRGNQVFCGINWLRENFLQPLDVDGLAGMLHMAPPTFRKHFKAVTSMSPTQYHKHLRLYEAQRRMLENHEDVATASYAVGYESVTQFSREYKRLFGDAPHRNVTALQAAV